MHQGSTRGQPRDLTELGSDTASAAAPSRGRRSVLEWEDGGWRESADALQNDVAEQANAGGRAGKTNKRKREEKQLGDMLSALAAARQKR